MTNSLGSKYRINARGYRGPDFQVPKPPGVFRIVFYGGSSVFDIGASEGEDWPHQVEKRLYEKGLKQVEIINAGVPGHSSYDSMGSLFAEGHLWQPDVVVLYTSWNDFPELASDAPLLRFLKPYDEKADPLIAYRNGFDRFLCETSQLYVRLRYRYFLWKLRVGLEGARSRKTNISRLTDSGFTQFKINLETFADVARNAGAVPVLMTEGHPFLRSHSREEDWKYWEEFQTLSLETMYEAEEKTAEMIRGVSNLKKTALIDAAKVLDGQKEFFIDHVHLSRKGSLRLAELTADAIEPLVSASHQ